MPLLKEESQYNATQSALKNARAKARTEYLQKQKEKQNKTFLEGVSLDDDRKEGLSEELLKRLGTKKFSNLYAFAQVETAGNFDRESLVGEWVKYDKGSDYLLLEKGLKGKGTGWCTAEGSACGQLSSGDFYVYYTNNKKGVATEPRIAIRMASDKIAEIRGVDPRQELEPVLLDTAREFYKELPGAEKYEKATSDMKQMTAIYNKCFAVDKETKEKVYTAAVLNKEEIRFFYEIDGEIEGFGYEKDFRVEEVRKKRNKKDDLAIFYDCKSEFIAVSYDDICEKTLIFSKGFKGAIDFRTHEHRGKLEKFLTLKKAKLNALPYFNFEGGISNVSLSSNEVDELNSFDGATHFLEKYSGEFSVNLNEEKVNFWRKSYSPPKKSFDVVILSYDMSPEIKKSGKAIYLDAKTAGLRPLTYSESMAFVTKKENMVRNTARRFISLVNSEDGQNKDSFYFSIGHEFVEVDEDCPDSEFGIGEVFLFTFE